MTRSRHFNSLIVQMNHTIDEMLVHAHAIDGLTFEDSTPFVPNDLVELIEQLRDKVDEMLTDVQEIIEGRHPVGRRHIVRRALGRRRDGLPGREHRRRGLCVPVRGVRVRAHSRSRHGRRHAHRSVTTGSAGRFAFSFPVPIDETWLGSHTLTASAEGCERDGRPRSPWPSPSHSSLPL